jgi:ribosomal protein S18 acetylase RimI-like enzyme
MIAMEIGANLEIATIEPRDLEGAAEAIASGEVFQRYGLTAARAREILTGAAEQTVAARLNGEAVGVALYRVGDPAPVPAYLRILAVRDGSRGKGVGVALLRYVEEQAFRRGPNLFLCCVTTNEGARRFYERHGYHAVGVLNDLIAPGIDEILYRKTLGPIRGYQPP